MPSIAQYLTEDHARCDGLFAEAENAVASGDWSAATKQFGAFQAATLRHFLLEEDILFPMFEAATGAASGPTVVMRSEHAQCKVTMDNMAEAVTTQDANSYLGNSETLLMLIRQHNLKEEQILYPMITRALGTSADGLIARMESTKNDQPA